MTTLEIILLIWAISATCASAWNVYRYKEAEKVVLSLLNNEKISINISKKK